MCGNVFSETEILELKKSTSELKEAVISAAAMLNKHGKGVLFFGVRNDGKALGQEVGVISFLCLKTLYLSFQFSTISVRKMNLLGVQERIALRGGGVFTGREFALFMDMSGTAAQKTLERYAKKGIFVRLRNNHYILKTRPAHQFIISNRIYRPSYVSFESAMSYHGIIPETVYEITAATTKPTRHYTVENQSYAYYKIKKEAYTGYEPVKIGTETVYLASPEKCLVDHLYMVNLGRAPLRERLSTKKLDKKKALRYALLFTRPKLVELLNKVLK